MVNSNDFIPFRLIQALGTLKLFKDIDEDNIVEGFKFTQFRSFEEANDNGVFYTPIQIDGKNEKIYEKLIIDLIYKDNSEADVSILYNAIVIE